MNVVILVFCLNKKTGYFYMHIPTSSESRLDYRADSKFTIEIMFFKANLIFYSKNRLSVRNGVRET